MQRYHVGCCWFYIIGLAANCLHVLFGKWSTASDGQVYTHAYTHVYPHVHAHACAHVYAHVCTQAASTFTAQPRTKPF